MKIRKILLSELQNEFISYLGLTIQGKVSGYLVEST
jgi:hypothetical protein